MAGRWPHEQPRNEQPRDYGNYTTPVLLPNAAGNPLPSPRFFLEAGDTATVDVGAAAGNYRCQDPGTPGGGDAIWVILGPVAVIAQWNLNGPVAAQAPQPASFDGLPVTDPALSGPGPFDGTRVVNGDTLLTAVHFVLRVPPPVLATVLFEVYRIRAGIVTSLTGTLALPSVAPNAFTELSFPIPAPLAPAITGDMLFVALAGTGPAGAEDFSVQLKVAV